MEKSDGVSESGLSRRDMLATLAVSGTLGVSGCLDSTSSNEPEQPPEGYEQEGVERERGAEPVSLVPELAWEFGTDGQVISSPVPVGNMLFVTSYDGRLYALAGEGEGDIQGDGYPVFKTDTTGTNAVGSDGPSRDIEEKWRFSTHGRVIQTPVVSDGDVFFGSEDNYFYSVSAETGEENWRFDAGRVVAGASPAMVDGTVYVPTGNSTEMNEEGVLYALDSETGDEIWSTEFEGGLGAAPVVDDGRLYTGCQDNSYYALDAETGEEVWSFEGDDVFCGSRAALTDGVVYAGSEDHSMYALDTGDGSLVWEFETGDVIVSSPVVTEDTVYFGSNDKNLYAVEPETGEELWSFDATGPVFSSPAYRDGVVYFGTENGWLFAVNGQTGEEVWSIEQSADRHKPIWSSPVVTEDMVYFGTGGGSVYGVRNRSVSADEYESNEPTVTLRNG
jgi:outer membrane protein assembly factor BamB